MDDSLYRNRDGTAATLSAMTPRALEHLVPLAEIAGLAAHVGLTEIVLVGNSTGAAAATHSRSPFAIALEMIAAASGIAFRPSDVHSDCMAGPIGVIDAPVADDADLLRLFALLRYPATALLPMVLVHVVDPGLDGELLLGAISSFNANEPFRHLAPVEENPGRGAVFILRVFDHPAAKAIHFSGT